MIDYLMILALLLLLIVLALPTIIQLAAILRTPYQALPSGLIRVRTPVSPAHRTAAEI